MNITQLFIALLQVSLRSKEALSYIPSSTEWTMLFQVAKKQSLIGVTFAGLQILRSNRVETVNLPNPILMKWLSSTMMIQQRNTQLNEKCIEAQQYLINANLQSLILKGQGTDTYYSQELCNLRQSGDIDIWILDKPSNILKWIKQQQTLNHCDYMHTHIDIFKDVKVEVHFRPWMSRNILRNIRLQEIAASYQKDGSKFVQKNGMLIPDRTFAIIHAIQHLHWHLLTEGVGLRQMLDLYFLLLDYHDGTITKTLGRLHLLRFTSGLMWVLGNVFGMKNGDFLCEPNEVEGRFLLSEIMKAGNFGRYDERLQHSAKVKKYSTVFQWIKHSFRLINHYPQDVLWNPIGIVYFSLLAKIQLKNL